MTLPPPFSSGGLVAEAVKGGSVMQTTAVALPVGAGLAIAQYLVAPSWPPPEPILAITVAATAPLWHLLGRAIYLRVASWAGDADEGLSPNGGSEVAAPVAPPPAPVPQTPPTSASVGAATGGTTTPTAPPIVVPMTQPPTATGATP